MKYCSLVKGMRLSCDVQIPLNTENVFSKKPITGIRILNPSSVSTCCLLTIAQHIVNSAYGIVMFVFFLKSCAVVHIVYK